MTPGHREAGAALLTVLILVGVIGVIAVAMLDRLRLATMLAGNAQGAEQARAAALAAETLALARVDTQLAAGNGGGLHGDLAMAGGSARAGDAGNCFNLNSLVAGTAPDALVARPLAIAQFVRLMTLAGIAAAPARRIAGAAADWIDSDDRPLPDGAEDAVYARATPAYRTANTLMAEASELRAVAGVTPAIYARLRPWLCALPMAELSPINVNTLRSDQAPMLAMLLAPDQGAGQGLATAARVLAERPAGGWVSVAAFGNTPTLRDHPLPADVLRQVQLRSAWLALDLSTAAGDSDVEESALIDAHRAPAHLVSRRWTADE